jgi:outer membrane protein assembly factor BamB
MADFDWRVKLPGYGHSSPAVRGGAVFLTDGDKETAKRYVLRLNASDGKVVWKKEYASQPHSKHKYNSYGTATPAVDAERLYVTWTTPAEAVLIALDHAGKEVWKTGLGPFETQHGSGASPIVWNDLVILVKETEAAESFLVAVDAKTGKPVWKHPRGSGKASYLTPCLYRPASGSPQLIFTSQVHGVTALDPRTGRKLWEVEKVFPLRVVSSPVVARGLIIGSCGSGGRGHTVAAVKPGAGAKVAWKLTKSVPYVPSPVAVGDLLFLWGDGGIVRCVKAATGEEVWTERVKGKYFASPICLNGKLYTVSQDGEMVVIAAEGTFKELARNPLGEGSYATPAVAGGRMIVRTFTHLLSVGGK